MKVIGLDIGTTSISGLVLDLARTEVLGKMTCPNTSAIVSSDDFSYLQDPSRILASIESILDALLTKEPDVTAIGISSQMHGVLYVDDVGHHVSPLYTWQDGRGDLAYSGSQSYCEVFRERTGYAVSTGYGIVTHFYHLVNDDLPAGAASMCTIGDYVAMKLAGLVRPVTDATLVASLGGFDIVKKQFDTAALQNVGVRTNFLPAVGPSGTPLGKYRGTITVHSAIGDNQASYLGAVRHKENTLLINVGTSAQLTIEVDKMLTVPQWETRPAVGGGYLLVGALLNGGNAYALLESFFRDVLRVFAGMEEGALFDTMERMVQDAGELRNPLTVVPQFYGTRENPQARGWIQDITPQNFTPVHLLVGTLNGLVETLVARYQELPSDLRTHIHHIVGAGNGIRKSLFLTSLIENRFAVPVEVARHEEEAAFGAALYAGESSNAGTTARERG
jgi:sedoheptulokinase